MKGAELVDSVPPNTPVVHTLPEVEQAQYILNQFCLWERSGSSTKYDIPTPLVWDKVQYEGQEVDVHQNRENASSQQMAKRKQVRWLSV